MATDETGHPWLVIDTHGIEPPIGCWTEEAARKLPAQITAPIDRGRWKVHRVAVDEWVDRVGREVIFRYPHGEELEGRVTSVNDVYVFVRFKGTANLVGESCDPGWLRLKEDGDAPAHQP